jgi:hypothetical protein
MADLSGLIGLAGFGAIMAALSGIGLMVLLVFYIYTSLALSTIAKKTKTNNPWLAWIPIANVYLMLKIAKVNPMWMLAILFLPCTMLLMMIPFIGILFGFLYFLEILALGVGMIYVWWKICEARKYPGWVALLFLVPLLNMIMPGIIAWRDN